jgi:hypothetical protein
VRLSSQALERTELILEEGVIRKRAGRFSRHRPDGEIRRVPDYRMLWKGSSLILFAHIPIINSIVSNAAELRQHSRHVVGVP